MTKKLLDIERLEKDLRQNQKMIMGIACYRYESEYNYGLFNIGLRDKILDKYWLEVEVEE